MANMKYNVFFTYLYIFPWTRLQVRPVGRF